MMTFRSIVEPPIGEDSPSRPERDPAAEWSGRPEGASPETPWRAPPGTVVLVVDDEEIVRNVARTIFRRAGFDVLEAVDGRDAVALFEGQRSRIDLVLLDVNMPRMAGPRTFSHLRGLRHDVPILLSSGYAESETIDALLDQGLADFLPKPYRPEELLQRARRMLLSARGSGGSEATNET